MKLRFIVFLGAILIFSLNAEAKDKNLKSNPVLVKLIDESLQDAAKQYEYFMKEIPSNRLPRSFEHGKLVTSSSRWWCSGFYPGTLLYLIQDKKNEILKEEAIRRLKLIEPEQFNRTTHDLGFMMYCSYGNANKMWPNPIYENILLNSANSLLSRYNKTIGCIRSWDSKDPDFLVIIDNMMNLELLFWAAKKTKDPVYYNAAIDHADHTIKNHFREDYSSYHLVNYNSKTGIPQEKKTVQGYSNESAWARGQGWGLYGFTVMYRETGDKKYLEQANHIAEYILNHPNLPADKIPYWDFNAPDIPKASRDVSAGAVIASALLELATYNQGTTKEKYFNAAEVMINSMCTTYKSSYKANGGFLLGYSVGNLPGKSEVDAPLTYADYYYVEALLRYKNIRKIKF